MIIIVVVVVAALAVSLTRNWAARQRWPLAVGLVVLGLFAVVGVMGTERSGDEKQLDAKVFFTAPLDGAAVTTPVRVVMAAEGLVVEPAGSARAGAGHFHLTVDGACVPEGDRIPAGAPHMHFGNAQQDTTLDLSPGEHTLCLQAGDGAHVAFGATDRITVAVSEPPG